MIVRGYFIEIMKYYYAYVTKLRKVSQTWFCKYETLLKTNQMRRLVRDFSIAENNGCEENIIIT